MRRINEFYTCVQFRLLFGIYIASAYSLQIFINRHLPPTEYENMALGPFHFLGIGVYMLAFPLFLFVFLLHKVVPPKNLNQTRALGGCIGLAGGFWILSTIGWLGSKPYYSSLAHMIALGGLFGVVEGVYRVPFVPNHVVQAPIDINAKRELLIYENAKWWHGLSIFWAVIVTALIGGLFTFVSQLPKASERDLLHLLASGFSGIPGVAMIVWNVLKRTNTVQDAIFSLYLKEAQSTKKGHSQQKILNRRKKRSMGL